VECFTGFSVFWIKGKGGGEYEMKNNLLSNVSFNGSILLIDMFIFSAVNFYHILNTTYNNCPHFSYSRHKE